MMLKHLQFISAACIIIVVVCRWHKNTGGSSHRNKTSSNSRTDGRSGGSGTCRK